MKTYSFDFYNAANLKAYNLNQTMRYQLSILDKMDPITKKHSESVANLVCRICEYLGYNWQATIHSTMNAYLHDVGKLAVPLEITNKPDRLTDEEYEIMKTHTTKGYEICMKDPKLRPYAEAALYHHEALNGTGYPRGLTKKDIPYIAQIVRVADEYDAIVSKRQYKTHIDISKTLKILIDEAKPEDHMKSVALDHLNTDRKLGRINPRILKILLKVVIDDVGFEISSLEEYLKYLKTEIKRLETINKYYIKMQNAKKDKDKEYFLEGIKLMFAKGETLDNFKSILEEFNEALKFRTEDIKKLHDEIKIIKKLKI